MLQLHWQKITLNISVFSPFWVQLAEHPNHLHRRRTDLLIIICQKPAGLKTHRHTRLHVYIRCRWDQGMIHIINSSLNPLNTFHFYLYFFIILLQGHLSWQSFITDPHNNHSKTQKNFRIFNVLKGFSKDKSFCYLLINDLMNLHSSLMQLQLETEHKLHECCAG